MPFTVSGRVWIIVSIVLVLIILTGSFVIRTRFPPDQPIEIYLLEPTENNASVMISGAVNSPGIYDMKTGDTVETILEAAGGTTIDADISRIMLSVPFKNNNTEAQKIDINHAESWLLEALPGIGEVLAQRIIEYRTANGPFHNINEITRVQGLTLNAYEKIKNYITVTD